MELVNKLTQPYFNYFPNDLAGLASAMVWGQKQHLSAYHYELFQKTGLLHLLVLSGQNITLLVSFFNSLSQALGHKVKLIITIGIALFYLLVFGGDPPIVRSSLMAIMSSLVILQQKNTLPIYLLFIVSSLLLLINPSWWTSLSFWLSVSATLGIQLFYPYFQAKYHFKNQLAQTFFLSLSAQILTTPLLILVFREVSLITLPMNVLVGWLVEPIMFLGVLLSLVGQFFKPLAYLISWFLFGLLQLLNLLVKIGYQIGQNWLIRI